MELLGLLIGLAGVIIAGLSLYFDYKEHKRNNPPSQKGKTDRNVG